MAKDRVPKAQQAPFGAGAIAGRGNPAQRAALIADDVKPVWMPVAGSALVNAMQARDAEERRMRNRQNDTRIMDDVRMGAGISGCACRMCRDQRAERRALENMVEPARQRWADDQRGRRPRPAFMDNPFINAPMIADVERYWDVNRKEWRVRPVGFDTIGRDEPSGASRREVDEARDTIAAVSASMERLLSLRKLDSEKRSTDNPLAKPVKAIMKALGWDEAGNGHFAIVFTKGELAIKFCLKPDRGSATYTEWASRNQGLAGVPVIHALHDLGKARFAVVMDKLMPGGGGHPDYDETYKAMSGSYGSNKPLSLTARRIREELMRNGVSMDFHDQNAMIDRRGNLVITDPICCI